jgi:Polyketide cyclase / dehydrase and lipid transport
LKGDVPPDRARSARSPDPGFGPRLSAEVERAVDAPIERVWAVLRDYRAARPRLLTEHFSGYVVQRRGEGAGTLIQYRLRVGRRRRAYVVAVEEPAPGRMLRERARGSALVVTWTLTPGGDGERTLVRLDRGRPGPRPRSRLGRAPGRPR